MKTIVFAFTIFALLSTGQSAHAQNIGEQKLTVAFIFGTVHQLNSDGTPKTDASGQRVEAEMPLGTGFFVSYPDTRGGPDYRFIYLVTAKHVLRDVDGKFLPKLKIRLNLKKSAGDTGFDFIKEIPVSDANGKLLWFHDDENLIDETVVFPLLPKESFDCRAIPLSMFVNESQLKSDAVAEGDNLYFIGLLTQFYGNNRNYPVVRRGALAMMTDEPVPTPSGPQKLFIAELQSWPGNSGSPVFLSLGGLRGSTLMVGQHLSLLGILLGVYNNNGLPIGVSFIEPATRISEVLASSAAQHRRDMEIQMLVKPKS